ncbi:DUF3427 domain-containing protein [Micrococcus terreus]|uniref:DUF3427 domain-containing protein n=1 Tax=Micrococcus TaxID=1269 RepID=UPI0033CA3683
MEEPRVLSSGRLAQLAPGVYEQLVTQAVDERLQDNAAMRADVSDVPGDAVVRPLAQHVSQLVEHALSAAKTSEQQREIAARVIAALGDGYAPDQIAPGEAIRQLREVRPAIDLNQQSKERPETPFSDVALITNASSEPSIGSEIRAELDSADRVDLLCAFVKWQGLRTMERELAALKERGVPFRVITTTYIGATERLALDRIVREFGGEVRISYATKSTRLHAKAWLFHRDSGYSTAYVGSSNLSRAAMLDGLEWNVRLSNVMTPALIRKFEATFESYWDDDSFEPYNPDVDGDRLEREIKKGSFAGTTTPQLELRGLDVRPYPHQVLMLQDLAAERAEHDRHRNLLVAATGTGKTVIAALDYRDLITHAGRRLKLLFVAHRQEILEQARHTYRSVLSDPTFGELYVGGDRPTRWEHVFASVQSLGSYGIENLPAEHFDVVVIDEFHHAPAQSYELLLSHLRPQEMLGLTATPERSDGFNVKGIFGGRIASEMRLWDALDADILVPFHYFGIADDVDLSRVEWKNGQYDRTALGKVYTGNDARTRAILKALRDKVGDLTAMKALGFCATVDHAHYMAEAFTAAGIPVAVIVGDTDNAARREALAQLRAGDIKVVFGVDVFNEGLDIPDVNTVLFLRPTQSATIFLQQLGRGLRRAHGKSVLTALDFVGHQRKEFRFDLKLRALTGVGRKQLVDDLHHDFPYLPSGSQIVLDEVARENILENIRTQVGLNVNQLAQDVRDHAGGRDVWKYRLADYLAESDRTVADVYRQGSNGRSWTTVRLRADRSEPPLHVTTEAARETLRVGRLVHVDDWERADAYLRILTEHRALRDMSTLDQQYAMMLFFTAIYEKDRFGSFDDGLTWARNQHAFVEEAGQLLEHVVDVARNTPQPMKLDKETALKSHAHYRREEILAGLNISSWETKYTAHVEGVAWSAAYQLDALLVTLNKDSSGFSPTTMYRDFAVSPNRFHWESQNDTTATSTKGSRYLAKRDQQSHTALFVRERSNDDIGTAAFLNLGTAQFGSWNNTERPMQINWDLDREMPLQVFREGSAIS